MKTPVALSMLGSLLLGACAKPTDAECEQLADHVIDLMVLEVAVENMEAEIREEAKKERPKLIEECKGSTKTEVDCLLKAASMADMDEC